MKRWIRTVFCSSPRFYIKVLWLWPFQPFIWIRIYQVGSWKLLNHVSYNYNRRLQVAFEFIRESEWIYAHKKCVSSNFIVLLFVFKFERKFFQGIIEEFLFQVYSHIFCALCSKIFSIISRFIKIRVNIFEILVKRNPIYL